MHDRVFVQGGGDFLTNLLELIGRLTASTEDAPVMVLCTSRRELLEKQPEWATGADDRRIVLLPLSDADAGKIIENLLGEAGLDAGVQAKVVTAAEGNPLFVEQLLSMLIDTGVLASFDGRWELVGNLAELKRAAFVRDATIFGQSIHLLMDASDSLDRIRLTLEQIGIADAEVKAARPSLEDVFVTLTKKGARV